LLLLADGIFKLAGTRLNFSFLKLFHPKFFSLQLLPSIYSSLLIFGQT
jgi:hypothetical protein